MRRWLFLLPLLFTQPLLAQSTCQANPSPCSTTSGTLAITITIGRAVQMSLNSTTTGLTAPTVSDFNTTYAPTTGPVATVSSNGPWSVAISTSAATWTATNTSPGQAARTNKPASDLTWSTTSNGTFRGLTTSAFTVASGTATASSPVSIFYRTLYNWTLDTPGIYSLQVVFTITAP